MKQTKIKKRNLKKWRKALKEFTGSANIPFWGGEEFGETFLPGGNASHAGLDEARQEHFEEKYYGYKNPQQDNSKKEILRTARQFVERFSGKE